TNLTNQVVGTGANALTNRWIFYDSLPQPPSQSDLNNYKHLKAKISSTGNWETYQYDQNGRVTRIVSQFKSNPFPANTSDENANRVTTIAYTTPDQEERTTTLGNTTTVVAHNLLTKTVVGLDDVVTSLIYTNSNPLSTDNLSSQNGFDIADSSEELYRRVVSLLDGFGRPQTFTFLDNSTETLSYICCGTGTFTNRAGVVTTTEYDDFRRVKSRTIGLL